MNQSAFSDLNDADLAVMDLIRTVAAARGWDPEDLADAEADIQAAYDESEGLIWDDVPLYWQRVADYVAAWPMDGSDKILAAIESGATAAADEVAEEDAGSVWTIASGTVAESADDVADAATTANEVATTAARSSWTGPILAGALLLGLVLVVRR